MILTVFVLAHVVIFFSSLLRGPQPPKPKPRPDTPLAGVAQAKRTTDFIAQTAAYTTFEECAQGLSERVQSDFDIVFDVTMQSNDPMPQMAFGRVLADRRAIKLCAFLGELPSEAASLKAAQLFDEKLEILRHATTSRIESASRHLESDKLIMQQINHIFAQPNPDRKQADRLLEEYNRLRKQPPQDPASIPVSPHQNSHAACCALFLCAHFCEPRTTLQKVDAWNQIMGPLREQSQANGIPGVINMDDQYTTLEPLYLANLYCHVLSHRAGQSLRQIQTDTAMTLPASNPVPVCAWDALSTPFDFNHIHQFQPVDVQNKMFDVEFFRSWGPQRRHSSELQQDCVNSLRARIEHLFPAE